MAKEYRIADDNPAIIDFKKTTAHYKLMDYINILDSYYGVPEMYVIKDMSTEEREIIDNKLSDYLWHSRWDRYKIF